MCKKPLLFLFFIIPQCLWGQAKFVKDTLFANSDSVVVTATRTERKLNNLTVPVTIINAKTIQQNGSLRLTDILKEQTGINLTSGLALVYSYKGLIQTTLLY